MGWSTRKIGKAEVTFSVDEIVGKQRPRHSYANGIQRTYTPKKTKDAEKAIAWMFQSKYGGQWADFTGEVRINVTTWKALAKSNPKRLEGSADLMKPDCDNILKLVMDALEGVAYHDDKQVALARVRKMPRLAHIKGNHIRIQLEFYKEKEE